MKLTFSLTQTPSARKSFRIDRTLKLELARSARSVAEGELSELANFTLGLIAMSDEELLQLNKSALGHDWYTDIITFPIERELDSLEAELYISVDRAAENAQKARISLEKELAHLVIHGVLHLAGYDDHDELDKKRMKSRERFYLSQR